MKREDQIKLIVSVRERLENIADRVMAEPIIRSSVTRRADEKFSEEYEASSREVRFG